MKSWATVCFGSLGKAFSCFNKTMPLCTKPGPFTGMNECQLGVKPYCPTSVADLTNCDVVEWEKIPAARFLPRIVGAVIASH